MVGEQADLTFPVEHLGTGPDALAAILKGSPMLKRLKEAQRPAIIVGPGVLNRPDSAAVLQQVRLLMPACRASSAALSRIVDPSQDFAWLR